MVAKGGNSQKNQHIKDPLVALEREIDDVVSCCWSIISTDGKPVKNKIKQKKNAWNKERNFANESTVTLEKIATDITNVLGNLKDHLDVFKVKPDSFSDVVPQLEQMFLESRQISRTNPQPYNKNSKTNHPKPGQKVIEHDTKPSRQKQSAEPSTNSKPNKTPDKMLTKSPTTKTKNSENTNSNNNKVNEHKDPTGNKMHIQNYSVQDAFVDENRGQERNQRCQSANSAIKNKSNQASKSCRAQRSQSGNPGQAANKNVQRSNDANKGKLSTAPQNPSAVRPHENEAAGKEKSPQLSGNKKTPSQLAKQSNLTGIQLVKSNNSKTPQKQSAQVIKQPINSANYQKITQPTKIAIVQRSSHVSENPSNQSSPKLFQQPLPPTGEPRNRVRINHVNISREIYDPLGILRDEVNKAIREKKTFTIRGNYAPVRRALLKRGWVEKIHLSYRDRINEELKKYQSCKITDLIELIRNKDIGEICKRLIKSKLMTDHQVDLYWSFNTESYKECPITVKYTKFNKFKWNAFSYTSKQGLCQAAKISHWFQIPGIAKLIHPRTYSLVKDGDAAEFIKDFNRTAAMSLMKWVQSVSSNKLCKLISPSGRIPLKNFDFAVNECYKIIKRATHEDIDSEIREASEFEWNEFLDHYYKILHIGNHFKEFEGVREVDLVRKANYILDKLKYHWPYLDMDGMMNIWILKPTNSSQGVGIHMCRTLKYVLEVVKSNPKRRYIIQKYIERPLLIYNTKFDIRQWFLISKSVPLTIWIYKECYLRFSSQTYNLRKLHESIHLTNNSVQCRYAKCTSRDISLPSYNMWDLKHFITYLSDIGYPNAFNEIIYPGMKENITAAVLLHQDKIDQRYNCFELYGADFILTEDFKPWLLEINSNPALHASTPVTARMCPAVLEDVVKVVIDYERNKNASTGRFELLYQGKITPVKCKELEQVSGKRLSQDFFYNPSESTRKLSLDKVEMKNSNLVPEAAQCIKQLGQGMRQTLVDLMELLKIEKIRKQNQMNRSIITILEKRSINTQTSQSNIGQIILKETLSNVSEVLKIYDIDNTDPKELDELKDYNSEEIKNKK